MSHLGPRVSALVDGELGHEARDRALAHVAHCAPCREVLDAERSVKAMLSGADTPGPSASLLSALSAMGEPGDPVAPRPRAMPLGPVVPTLPPPGRGPFSRRTEGRRDGRRPPSARRAQRSRVVAASALSVAALVLGTAFAAGGPSREPGVAVVPPAAELSVEHAATTGGLPLGDPAFTAVTANFGGLTVQGASSR